MGKWTPHNVFVHVPCCNLLSHRMCVDDGWGWSNVPNSERELDHNYERPVPERSAECVVCASPMDHDGIQVPCYRQQLHVDVFANRSARVVSGAHSAVCPWLSATAVFHDHKVDRSAAPSSQRVNSMAGFPPPPSKCTVLCQQSRASTTVCVGQRSPHGMVPHVGSLHFRRARSMGVCALFTQPHCW